MRPRKWPRIWRRKQRFPVSAKPRPAAQGSHLDLRCYHVTGAPQEKVVQVAAAAAAGGAGVIQVRSKPISVRDLTALAIDVAAAVEEANPATKVLIDDRVDVAAALMDDHHIHGVHIGQDDLTPHLARQILGEDAIIGLTTGTLELVQDANEYADVIDYIGAGPFRPTPDENLRPHSAGVGRLSPTRGGLGRSGRGNRRCTGHRCRSTGPNRCVWCGDCACLHGLR